MPLVEMYCVGCRPSLGLRLSSCCKGIGIVEPTWTVRSAWLRLSREEDPEPGPESSREVKV